jgi:hypothetical protein
VFTLLWLSLCLAAFFSPSASRLVESEGRRVDGALSMTKALTPTDDRLASLRRANWAQNDPLQHNPDAATLSVFTLPVLVLAAWYFFSLQRMVPLPAIRHPGSPRAPPASLPIAV